MISGRASCARPEAEAGGGPLPGKEPEEDIADERDPPLEDREDRTEDEVRDQQRGCDHEWRREDSESEDPDALHREPVLRGAGGGRDREGPDRPGQVRGRGVAGRRAVTVRRTRHGKPPGKGHCLERAHLVPNDLR